MLGPGILLSQQQQIKLMLCPGTINNLCFVLSFIITLKYFKCDTSTFIYTNKFNQYKSRLQSFILGPSGSRSTILSRPHSQTRIANLAPAQLSTHLPKLSMTFIPVRCSKMVAPEQLMFLTSPEKKCQFKSKLLLHPAVVAWIVRALFSHSVEEYVLAIGGSNPAIVQRINRSE